MRSLRFRAIGHEYSDSAWIQLAGAAHAARFAGMLFALTPDPENDDLLTRQKDWEVATPEPSNSRAAWRWKAAPSGGWDLDVMVEFPVEDLAEVEHRLAFEAAPAEPSRQHR